MKLYTALDVSLRSVAICVVNEHGEVQYETKVEADVQRLLKRETSNRHELMRLALAIRDEVVLLRHSRDVSVQNTSR